MLGSIAVGFPMLLASLVTKAEYDKTTGKVDDRLKRGLLIGGATFATIGTLMLGISVLRNIDSDKITPHK